MAETIPVITNSCPDGFVKVAYSVNLTADGGGTMVWSKVSGTLPAGVSLSSGWLTGTPTTAKTYKFTLQARNNAGAGTKDFTVKINAQPTTPSVTTTALAEGKVGTSYSTTLQASGGGTQGWTRTAGTLPTGLSLSTAGVISGTPTTAGTYTFTVKVTNQAGYASKQLSITIVVPPPSITTASLLTATAGTAYSATLAASGTTPITWSLASGKLPPGLTLSSGGVISGTVPSVKGTYNAEATVETNWGTDTKAITIIVE